MLDVDDRRQSGRFTWNGGDEVPGLLGAGLAGREEVVGAARHAGFGGVLPVALEALVAEIAALSWP